MKTVLRVALLAVVLNVFRNFMVFRSVRISFCDFLRLRSCVLMGNLDFSFCGLFSFFWVFVSVWLIYSVNIIKSSWVVM